MTTLRDIISEETGIAWIDGAGTVWDYEGLIAAENEALRCGDPAIWLDREAQCIDGAIHFVGPDGYVQSGEAVMREYGRQNPATGVIVLGADMEYHRERVER